MHAVLVCRMGSSRFPGKTLMPFGGRTVLAHIVDRIGQGGIRPADILICTSDLPEDAPILLAAQVLGCKQFAGSPHNVSGRIIEGAKVNGISRFILVLGDNPWIDPGQIAEVSRLGEAGACDYIVTATPELPSPWGELMYPTGTRLQFVERALMEQRLQEIATPDVEEHASKLFIEMPSEVRAKTLSARDGWKLDEIADLNISINTRDDYERALALLDRVGQDASAHAVTRAAIGGAC